MHQLHNAPIVTSNVCQKYGHFYHLRASGLHKFDRIILCADVVPFAVITIVNGGVQYDVFVSNFTFDIFQPSTL
jgi:hypothetical protein